MIASNSRHEPDYVERQDVHFVSRCIRYRVAPLAAHLDECERSHRRVASEGVESQRHAAIGAHVTRARDQAEDLIRSLRELGADVLPIPMIKIVAPDDKTTLVEVISSISEYDWLVFTSPNGVTTFFEYFFRQFHDMRDLGGARIAAVGPATAKKLKDLHLQVDLMPEEAIGSAVAEAFKEFESIENLKICLLRAEVANRDLPEVLEEQGAIVDDIALYQTLPETEDVDGVAASLREKGADWILFTSGSTVEHFHARFNLPELRSRFPGLRLATIGPETTKAMKALGVTPEVEARQHTADGLIDSVLKAQA